jgi:hypothetical protein
VENVGEAVRKLPRGPVGVPPDYPSLPHDITAWARHVAWGFQYSKLPLQLPLNPYEAGLMLPETGNVGQH